MPKSKRYLFTKPIEIRRNIICKCINKLRLKFSFVIFAKESFSHNFISNEIYSVQIQPFENVKGLFQLIFEL